MACSSGCEGTESAAESSSKTRRGTAQSWHAFGQARWKQIYPWILEKQDGIYCLYCSHSSREVRSLNSAFISKPYTGIRPDKLGWHESCKSHLQNQQAYMEFQVRVTTNTTVVDVLILLQ